jgi:hypothetical protein
MYCEFSFNWSMSFSWFVGKFFFRGQINSWTACYIRLDSATLTIIYRATLNKMSLHKSDPWPWVLDVGRYVGNIFLLRCVKIWNEIHYRYGSWKYLEISS